MPTSAPQPQSPRRRWAFRAAAIVFGLGILVFLELCLRLAGVQRYLEPATPLVGFSETRALFTRTKDGDRFEIPESRRNFFQPDSFSAEKTKDEFRIFCFGGSTVQGRPYSIETSFTTWLEINLQAADTSRTWQVVNCGGVSYASYRLVPLIEECLGYEPDLFIVYTGHNEFLEARSYENIKHRPAWLRNLQDRVEDLRIAGLMRSLLPSRNVKKTIDMPAEVDALLDYQGGLAKYNRDDNWQAGVIYEYEQNLQRMIELANQAGTPILFVNPVSNVRDTPPFKVVSELTGERWNEFEQYWEDAKELPWDDLVAKQRAAEKAVELDSRHAEALFLLGRIHEAKGDIDQAFDFYLRAKDEDICPLRMLESMHVILRRVTALTGTRLVDVRSVFETDAKLGIPGDDQLIDHVHPRIVGHQKIAELLMRELQAMELVHVSKGWETRRQELVKQHYASLPDNYFPESVERLRGLQRWAEGRVMRLKLPADQ